MAAIGPESGSIDRRESPDLRRRQPTGAETRRTMRLLSYRVAVSFTKTREFDLG